MTEPAVVEVLYSGGPADGAIREVTVGPDGQPPALITFGGGRVYVGSSDVPAPTESAVYLLVPSTIRYGPRWEYEYVETLEV